MTSSLLTAAFLASALTAAASNPAGAEDLGSVPDAMGSFELIAVDRHDDTGDTVPAVITDSGQIMTVEPDSVDPGIAKGDRVTVNDGQVEAAPTSAGGRKAATDFETAEWKTTGVRSVLVVLANVNGTDTIDGVIGARLTDLDLYMQETSAGQLRLSAGVTAWLNVSPPALGACDSNGNNNMSRMSDLMNRSITAANNAGYGASSYDSVIVYSPYISGCGFSGMATVGGGLVWIARGSFTRGIVAHELGHNFGLPHSQALDCGAVMWAASCAGRSYGDPFSSLGWASNGGHFNTPEQQAFGWMRTGEVVTAAAGSVRLNPVSSTTWGPSAMTVPAANGTFWFEYRTAAGYDSFIRNTGYLAGVQVRWVPAWGHPIPGDDGPLLLDAHPEASTDDFRNASLVAGETWFDPGGQYRVVVASADATGATLNIVDSTLPPVSEPPVGPAVDTAQGTFKPITPTRLIDTRPTGVTGQGVVEVNVVSASGAGGLPTASDKVTGAVLNLTVTNATSWGYLTAYPCGTAVPPTSSLNFGPGDTTAAAVLVKTGGGKVCVNTTVPLGRVDVVVDVTGWFGSANATKGARMTAPTQPVRVADTRLSGGRLGWGQTLAVNIGGAAGLPADATGAVISLTVTEPAAANYVTAYPCGQPLPPTSSINMGANQTRTNTVVVGLDPSSRVCFYTVVPTHLVIDVMATFGPAGSMSGLRFEAENPTRILDTRTVGRPVPMQGVQPLPGAGALALTVTSTQAVGDGFLTVFDCASAVPVASNVTFQATQTRANAVVIQSPGPCALASQTTHLVVDRTGKFLP